MRKFSSGFESDAAASPNLGRNGAIRFMPMYTGTSTHMGSTITSYQGRPLAFLAHYVARHRLAHGIVLGSVTLAVIAAV